MKKGKPFLYFNTNNKIFFKYLLFSFLSGEIVGFFFNTEFDEI